MVAKSYTTKRSQKGGGSKAAQKAQKAFKSKITWKGVKRFSKQVIDPRVLISTGVGLSKGIATGALGATRILGTAGLQKLKQIGQQYKVDSVQQALQKQVRKSTGYKISTMNSYERARQEFANKKATYVQSLQGNRTDAEIAKIKQDYDSASTKLATAQQTLQSEIKKISDSQGVSQSLITIGTNSPTKQQIQQQLATALKTQQNAEIAKLQQLRQQLSTTTTTTGPTDANIGKIENQIKTLRDLGITALETKITRRQNRVARTANRSLLSRIGSKFSNLGSQIKTAKGEGYQASRKALGSNKLLTRKGLTKFAKGIFLSLPKTVINQSFDVLGKETSQIKLKTRLGTVHVGEIGRKMSQSVSTLFGRRNASANLLVKIGEDGTKLEKIQQINATQKINIESSIRNLGTNFNILTGDSVEVQYIKNAQKAIITGNSNIINSYQTAIADKQEKSKKLRDLELRLQIASPVERENLLQQVRDAKIALVQSNNASTQAQTNVRRMLENLPPGDATNQLKSVANAINNYENSIRQQNRLQTLMDVSSKNLASSYQADQTYINKFTETTFNDVGTKSGVSVDLLKNNPTSQTFDNYIAAITTIKGKLQTENDPEKRKALESAEKLLTSRVNIANTLVIVPDIQSAVNTLGTTATTTAAAAAPIPAPTSAPAPAAAPAAPAAAAATPAPAPAQPKAPPAAAAPAAAQGAAEPIYAAPINKQKSHSPQNDAEYLNIGTVKESNV